MIQQPSFGNNACTCDIIPNIDQHTQKSKKKNPKKPHSGCSSLPDGLLPLVSIVQMRTLSEPGPYGRLLSLALAAVM